MNTLTTQACLRTYNRLFKENDELYHEIARCFGLSDCALWILYTIREEEQALTQSDICESLFLPRQTIHSAIKKLEEEGVLTLRYKEGNRKNKELALTKQGQLLAERTADQVIAAEERALSHLSEAERSRFLQLYQKYIGQLRKELAEVQSAQLPQSETGGKK